MPGPITFIKPTFASGEFSPFVQHRVDIQKYATGAKLLRNMIVHPQGGASNRPGTQFVAATKISGKKSRVIPFQFSDAQRYVVEFGHLYFRFYMNGAAILNSSPSAWVTSTLYKVGSFVLQNSIVYYCLVEHTSGTFATDLAAHDWLAQSIYEVPSPYTESDLPDIRYAQSADTLFIVHPSHAPQMLQRFGATDFRLTAYPFTGGPFQLQNTIATQIITPSAVTGAITLGATGFQPFKLTHVGSLWRFHQYIQGQTQSVSLSAPGAGTAITCGGTWRIITHGTWTGKISVQQSTDAGVTWTDIRTFASTNDNNVETYGTIDNLGEPFLVRLFVTSYTSGPINVDLTTDAFYQDGIVQITGFTSGILVNATVITDLGAAVDSIDWSEGSWSDYRGWPSDVSFTDDRLAFGRTDTEPQTIWMTETGNYYSFKRTTGTLLDTDGISINLPSRELNEINGFIPLLGLVAFTSEGAWTIGTPGTPLTPTTISAKVNEYNGSYGVPPLVVGNRAIYVQSSGRVIRDIGYDWSVQGFTGSNISILATHLFSGYTITEMSYQQDPDSIVWMVRSDGILISMTTLREQEVLAFTWHDTDGEFESVCCIQGNGYKEIWLSVNRGGQRYIERFVERMASTAPEDQMFLDCAQTYDGSPATTITNLDHLNGMGVGILADGNVIANYNTPVTVSGGQIILDTAASIVHVGLPYLSDIETLNAEVNTPSGTAQGKRIKITRLGLELWNSRGGYVGSNFTDMYPLGGSTITDYGNAADLFTGLVQETLGDTYEEGGRVCIRQADPLPITILALIPQITVGGTSGVQS